MDEVTTNASKKQFSGSTETRGLPLLDLLLRNQSSNTSGASSGGNTNDVDVLTRTNTMLLQFFSRAENVSVTDIRVEISRTNLTTDIRFDAITLEIPLDYLPHRRLTYNNTALELIPVKETPTGNHVYDMLKYEDCSGNACVVQLTEYNSSEAEHYTESQAEA